MRPEVPSISLVDRTLSIIPEISNHDEATSIACHNLLLSQAASKDRRKKKKKKNEHMSKTKAQSGN